MLQSYKLKLYDIGSSIRYKKNLIAFIIHNLFCITYKFCEKLIKQNKNNTHIYFIVNKMIWYENKKETKKNVMNLINIEEIICKLIFMYKIKYNYLS